MEAHLAPEGPVVLEQGSPQQWEAQMIQLTAVGGSSLRGKEDFPESNALALLEPRNGGVYKLLLSLKKEIRERFEISENNQAKIQEACVTLETKINQLTDGVGMVEEAMEQQKNQVLANSQDIAYLKRGERAMQDKLEFLENNMRRNNIRVLGVPEGAEGADLKGYLILLIKEAMPGLAHLKLEDDIQRIHRDPFKKNPGRKCSRIQGGYRGG
ncbi:hypothetical protein NDU88_004197 [Pleurodeles waltl]|uniref:Uncharacterized protein n=1 Tax=Pleurodeles waltl TaxID=8319 RepID=A0AAV7MUH1_PLEWA|nr:hypothetical protein NDU88_004197 [Pleurodeles waltl]